MPAEIANAPAKKQTDRQRLIEYPSAVFFHVEPYQPVLCQAEEIQDKPKPRLATAVLKPQQTLD
jgi:hypothetical protein